MANLTRERRAKIAELIFERIGGLVGDLYSRWLDEQEYEELSDYAVPIQNHIARYGATVVHMTRKPFGFIFALAGAMYMVKCTEDTYSYQRIV